MNQGNMSRREVLRLGILAPMFGLPVSRAFSIFGEGNDKTLVNNSRYPQLVSSFADRISALMSRNMGIIFTRINDAGNVDFEIGVNADKVFATASVFKFFVVLYYFMEAERYKPGGLDEAWEYGEDSDVYKMAVYSNNTSTGNVIGDVARQNGITNPIVGFNDFLTTQLGMEYGLYSWAWKGSGTNGHVDSRNAPSSERAVVANGVEYKVNNVTTARDAARGAILLATAEMNPLWEESPKFRSAVKHARALLSIPVTLREFLPPFDKLFYEYHYGKDGALPADPAYGGFGVRVINDLVVIPWGDGTYVVSLFTASESEYGVDPVVSSVIDSVREYEQALNPAVIVLEEEESAPVVLGEYNYGFVKQDQISIWRGPSEDFVQVPNPVRRNSLLGTSYVMRGAMLRLMPADQDWAKIVPDDSRDEAYDFADAYVKLSDVSIIDPARFSYLGYVGGEESADKFIILDVNGRTLTCFEGEQVVFSTPVVCNSWDTPRGQLYINLTTLSRDMPNYPGVPWCNLLHDGKTLASVGYYVHGSPWHRWQQTINKQETFRRFSHGCVNVPDWVLSIGPYTMRPDEFIFRWIAGFRDYGDQTLFHIPGNIPIVRVYVLDYPETQIFRYNTPPSVARSGLGWGDILRNLRDTPLNVPEYFFD